MSKDPRSALATMGDAEASLRLADPSGVEHMLADVSRLGGADRRLCARVLSARSTLEYLRSRFDRSFEASCQAIESWTLLGDRAEAASARAVGARVLLAVGSVEDALAEALMASGEATRDGDARAIQNTTTALGHVYFAMQRLEQALACFESALQIARTLDDRIGEGAMLDAVACVYGCQAAALAERADRTAMDALLTRALRLWEQAMAIARETRHRRNLAAVLANEAEALMLSGRAEDALSLLQCWKLDPVFDLPRVIWHLRDTEGVVLNRLGRHAEAITRLTEALQNADSGVQKMSVHGHLSEAFEHAGDAVAALAHYKHFHAFYRQVASEAAQRSASVAAVRLANDGARVVATRDRVASGTVGVRKVGARIDRSMHALRDDDADKDDPSFH